MGTLRSAGLVGLVLLAAATAAQAHHSTTAFESSRTATVTGIVAKLDSRSKPPTQGAAQTALTKCPRVEVVEVMPQASADTRPVAYRNGTIHVRRTPLSTLADVIDIQFNPPRAIGLTFTPQVGERMERITARPNFP